jgi:hypothetical protein
MRQFVLFCPVTFHNTTGHRKADTHFLPILLHLTLAGNPLRINHELTDCFARIGV